MKTIFKNYTPHSITLNDGTEFQPLGLARVSARFTDFLEGVCSQEFGDISGLPAPQNGVLFIVSGLVLAASDRPDLVAPATGHPLAKRNSRGHIISVPGFVR
jgi:hypothetical protein